MLNPYLRYMDKIKAVIFDCDGVLVDSEHLSCTVWQEMAAKRGVDLSIEYIHENYVGGSIYQIVDLYAQLVPIENKTKTEQEYRRLANEKFFSDLKPINGIIEVLESSNLPRSVASNGPHEKVVQNLKITKLDKYFDPGMLFSGHDYGFKPSPKMLLHSAKAFNLRPQDCLFIDDSLTGVMAAHHAGMEGILFSNQMVELPSNIQILSSMLDIKQYILDNS